MPIMAIFIAHYKIIYTHLPKIRNIKVFKFFYRTGIWISVMSLLSGTSSGLFR